MAQPNEPVTTSFPSSLSTFNSNSPLQTGQARISISSFFNFASNRVYRRIFMSISLSIVPVVVPVISAYAHPVNESSSSAFSTSESPITMIPTTNNAVVPLILLLARPHQDLPFGVVGSTG